MRLKPPTVLLARISLLLVLAVAPAWAQNGTQPTPPSGSFPTQITISDAGIAVPPVLATTSRGISTVATSSEDGDAENVIVVCPPSLLPTFARWIEYRQQQGYRIFQVDARMSAAEILVTIRRQARLRPISAIVLVGDGDLTMQDDLAIRNRSVPPLFAKGTINAALGAEDHVATDNPYGDLNADGVAEIPVGRLSADTPEQLERIIDRIIRYESLPRNGAWRRTVHLAAAVGDFGVLADAVIETAAKKFLADGIPPAFLTTMTYGSWRSPFCPDPRAFRDNLLSQVEQGCLFWVYMGHGHPSRLDRFRVGDMAIPVLEAGDVARFRSSHGSPIAILLACYAGAFDQPEDCLAERMLRTDDGPVAVLAASRITMPYSMAILANALMESFFERPETTLGQLMLQGKRGLASEATGGKNRKLIESLAKTLSPTKEQLPVERAEHQQLFNLLGDPLLRVSQPSRIDLHCPSAVESGGALVLRGVAPFAGTCHVELVCRRDRLTFTPPRRRTPSEEDAELREMTAVYARANDPRWYQRQFEVQAGRFAIEMQVPKAAHGPSHARLALDGDHDSVIGSADVYIRQPEQQGGRRTSNAAR